MSRITQILTMVLTLAVSGFFMHCGKLPSAEPGGNDFEEDGGTVGVGPVEMVSAFSAVGESTQVVYTESFMAVVSLGRPVEVSTFDSDSFSINNGLDLVDSLEQVVIEE